MSNDVVLVAGGAGIEAFDASTGHPLWKREGVLTFDNRYGTVGVQARVAAATDAPIDAVDAVDVTSGDERWSYDGSALATCGDYVVLLPRGPMTARSASPSSISTPATSGGRAPTAPTGPGST